MHLFTNFVRSRHVPTTHSKTSQDTLNMFRLPNLSVHFFLAVYAVIALLPFGIIVLNSFKTRSGIFGDPLSFPDPTTLSTAGYQTLFASTDFLLYVGNSTIITSVSLLFIIGLGACAAYGLLESKTTLSKWTWLLLIVGIMIPLRLGTVGLLELMKSLNLLNSLIGLICIYVAQGLPSLSLYTLRCSVDSQKN